MAKLASPSGMLGRRSFYAKRHARLSLALPRSLSTCSLHLPTLPRTGAVSSVASSQPWTTRLSWKRSVAAPRHRCRACLSEFDRGQPGGMQNSANYEKNDAYLASLHCDTISIEGAPPFMILGPDGESKLIDGWSQKYNTDMFTSSQNQVNVLRAMKIKKILGVTPFGADLNKSYANYFEASGIGVVAMEGI